MNVNVAVFFTWIVLTKVVTGHLPHVVTEDTSLVWSFHEEDLFQNDEAVENEYPDIDIGDKPRIYELEINTNINNRFATTLVKSNVENAQEAAKETTFLMILPKNAFITNFVISTGGMDFGAHVKEKEEAKQLYEKAIASGSGAAHVAARDSNRFSISVNVEPKTTITFQLTYEELLERKDNKYQLVININPKQPVEHLAVNVDIRESQRIQFVRAPPIRSGNQVGDLGTGFDPNAEIHHTGSSSAVVFFRPKLKQQIQLAQKLGTDDSEGLAGQFIVEYDVERPSEGGTILLQDGYFVHFFAPTNLPPLPKHVLFVLDNSGSMVGRKIRQLKEAMNSILVELKTQDLFHLVFFNGLVNVLDVEKVGSYAEYPSSQPAYNISPRESNENLSGTIFTGAHTANSNNVKSATTIVNGTLAGGGTNIYDALKVALHLVDLEHSKKTYERNIQPMILFLTDGDPTIGVTNHESIIEHISKMNRHRVPIFTLSFGSWVTRSVLETLSLRNFGFTRHIYEAADAALQLKDFYEQVSSPSLKNVTFQYIEDTSEVTKSTFPVLFDGSELVVSGHADDDSQLPKVTAIGAAGPVELTPEFRKPVTKLERLWAYLTVKQLLEEKQAGNSNSINEKKALNLALKFSFVTPLTSLIVSKPNSTSVVVDPEQADLDSDLEKYGAKPIPTVAPSDKTTSRTFTSTPVEKVTVPSTVVTPLTKQTTTSKSINKGSTTTTSKPLSKLEQLINNMPWLSKKLVNGDTINIHARGDLNLGLNEKTISPPLCASSPMGGLGYCTLLHECTKVHSLLTNVYIYQQYHCGSNGFANVCCPPK